MKTNSSKKTKKKTQTKAVAQQVVNKRAVKVKTRPAPKNQLSSVEMRNMNSELIQDISYSNGDLYVTMRNGASYRYPGVDGQTALDFLMADSFGRFFNENIRHLDYERLDD